MPSTKLSFRPPRCAKGNGESGGSVDWLKTFQWRGKIALSSTGIGFRSFTACVQRCQLRGVCSRRRCTPRGWLWSAAHSLPAGVTLPAQSRLMHLFRLVPTPLYPVAVLLRRAALFLGLSLGPPAWLAGGAYGHHERSRSHCAPRRPKLRRVRCSCGENMIEAIFWKESGDIVVFVCAAAVGA